MLSLQPRTFSGPLALGAKFELMSYAGFCGCGASAPLLNIRTL